MIDKQSKLKTLFNTFTPSAIGLVMYLFFSAAVIFLHQIPVIEGYLQIPRNFDLLRIVTGWLDKFLTSFIGQGRTEVLVVGAFWALVGLGVYLFLRGIERFITEFSQGMDERKYLWPKGIDRNRGVIEAAERTSFRIAAFVGLLIIIFGPLARVLDGPVWVSLVGPDTVLRLTVWLLAIMATIHACIILVRLMLLRPRLLD